MPVRLLITCGLLAIACPVSAQVYHGYGHDGLYHGYAVPAPHHHDYYAPSYGPHGRALHPYSHGYRVPSSWHGDVSVYRSYGHANLYLGHSESPHGYGATACVAPLQCNATGCESLGMGGCPQCDSPHGELGDIHQPFRGDSHAGHSHDPGHAHDNLSPVPHQGDIGRPREVPGRSQVAPQLPTLPQGDRQPLTPPSLPRSLQPERSEAPLGDAPPPPTVPIASPSGYRAAEPNLLNI